MSNSKKLLDMNDGTTVSNSSPQSPPGRSLLDPITLDFDPMSFEFKEEPSPLTFPSDNEHVIDEMISPSQDIDVVDFFDPLCPVKEESPTDCYPNVMFGQNELIDALTDPRPYSNGYLNFETSSKDLINESYQEEQSGVSSSNVNDQLVDYEEIYIEQPNELINNSSFEYEYSFTSMAKSEFPDNDEILAAVENVQDDILIMSTENDQVFDDNKHDTYFQHEICQIIEDDVSRKSRTSSSSSHSSKSEKSEKKSYKSLESNCKEGINETPNFSKKEIQKKGTAIKTETNGYMTHNGVNKKNMKNIEYDVVSDEEKGSTLASVTDLKTSFTKTNDDLQQPPFQEEVKPSVDRVKVQRTFSQNAQDELCLCKICKKHVYQMEKMKAEKNVFHKNCFRCKECNKLLNVDSYSSNEGDIYCKPHFRQLFQPKARFGGEDAAPKKQRRNEMIIRENVPVELPPDVVRSDSKPDHGLENIPVNLSSIKSRFEAYREEHHLPSTTDVCTLQRSASVMSRLAKYQNAVSGGDNENGDVSASDNDEEEYGEDVSVVKSSKHKEKVVFSGMSSLKSQWETGSVAATKEERIEEKKEELNKLRQRICLGRSESMKAVYEKACQDTSKSTSSRAEIVDLGRDVKATHLKEKFERGELVNDVDEENLEKVRKEKEDDLSVFCEPGIANDAKKLFKQIDASVKTVNPTKSPNRSPINGNVNLFYSPSKDMDVIKCSEPTEREEVPIDTTDVSQRFKFFENYSDEPKERKRFQITPPREPVKEDTPDREIYHDPNIVRSADVVDDIPSTDTARRMLDKFKALEKETPTVPSGMKPLKRITPPREYTQVEQSHDTSPEPERDPSIIRSSYKVDDDIIVEADKTKSLKAKFENWDTELKDSRRDDDDEEDEENCLPQIDTTKNLRAKFEAIKEDTLKQVEKPKPKVNRFIQEQASINTDMCSICNKKVYPMEKMETSGMRIHKNCFRCAHCSCMLRLENYTKSGRNLYCTPHFKQLFISRGNYDEGFGREQHKEKWNRTLNNVSVSQDLQESGDLEFSNGDVQCLEQTA